MLKILFIPTGNVFTLPDEEAIRIKKEDRDNEYKILDAGFQEEKQEVLPEETVREIVLKDEETKRQLEEEEMKSIILQEEEKKKKLMRPLDQFSRLELITYARKLGLNPGKRSNPRIIAMIHEKLGN